MKLFLLLILFLISDCVNEKTEHNEELKLNSNCDSDLDCEPPLKCVKGVFSRNLCTISCQNDDECPTNEYFCDKKLKFCLLISGKTGSHCITDYNCNPYLFCFKVNEYIGYCTENCTNTHSCYENFGNVFCIKLSNNFGSYCLQKCETNQDSSIGMYCRQLSKNPLKVCFPW